jgi:hypothetical protein
MAHWTEKYIPEPNSGCWLWTGSIKREGGKRFRAVQDIWQNGRPTRRHASRVVWKDVKGPVPSGMHVLHRCGMGMCVNPDHLYLGTNDDNIQDRVQHRQYCFHGHWLSEDNVYRVPSRPVARYCLKCMQIRNAAAVARTEGG